MGEFCPITGEPLQPGQSVSRGAVNKFHTYIKTLPSLMADVDYALAAARGEGGCTQACMPKAPINLALLDEAAEMIEAINTWATEWMTHLSGEAPRIFVAGDWNFIARIFSCQEGKLSRWDDAPACIDEIIYVLDRLEYLISKQREAVIAVSKPSTTSPYLSAKRSSPADCTGSFSRSRPSVRG